jgi:EAL domain-containing protein (putative c-di-GMP-specific phosphodiesterase class I)
MTGWRFWRGIRFVDDALYSRAAKASGAIAFTFDLEQARFSGPVGDMGLLKPDYRLDDIIDMLAPGDREDFVAALVSGIIDLRVRMIGEEGAVRYLRFIGSRSGSESLTGLVLPAGRFSLDARDQLDRETRVTDAVEGGEILAHYQPIIALETGALAGFEALARWDRPGVGIIGPDDFLPLANDLDLLGEIGDQVRETAARDLAAWRKTAATSPLFMAANASVGELLSDGFADRLIAAVTKAGLRAGTYKLEIAETEIMREPDRAVTIITELKAAGIQIALDDFGTGYSSLSRLDEFSFDTVKIDRYFVRAMSTSGSAVKVVESVLQLAKHYGMTVVAEGIESAGTARQLAEMGCDFGQGFRFAGALAPELAAEIVKSGLPGRIRPPSD